MSKKIIVSKSSANELADLQAQLATLRAENARLQAEQAASEKALSLKITEKGGVSVYGLGRFPTTLYPKQWRRILDIKANILAFIDQNQELLDERAEVKKSSKVNHLTAFVLCCLLAFGGNNAMAQDIELYGHTVNTVSADYNPAQFEKSWKSDVPSCVKDGATLCAVNAAFRKAQLGSKQCSTSDAAVSKQRKLGYTVNVYKFSLLPKSMTEQVSKFNPKCR